MADTFTTRTNLRKPANNDPNWDVLLNADFDVLDAVEAVGSLAVANTAIPSASLNVKVAAGTFRKADGTIVTYAGTASQAMTTATTNYVYLTDAGTLTVNTTGFPAATNIVPLAVVVAGATTITSITDARRPFLSFGASISASYLSLAGGTFTDGSGVVTVGLGSTNGTKIGATGDKLGFLGATPVVQQANSVDLAALLAIFGLRASGGNPPLNLGTGAVTCGAITSSGTITRSDGSNIVLGTTTGSKFGTATTQKLSFWNAAPIVQPAGANQAALGTLTLVTMTDSTTGTASDTVGDVGASFSQATLNSIHASFVREINRGQADFASVKTLLNQIRSDLVAAGILKGSA